MLKRSLAISMAFVGTLAGAGFASGQEAMTYFVAFGNWGIVGALLGSIVMIICGIAILQRGSYYQAREHTAVIDRITNSPIIAKILTGAPSQPYFLSALLCSPVVART